MQTIDSKDAPKAVGHYCQAIKAGGFLFTSGQIPIDPKSNQLIGGCIKEQTSQVLKNLSAIIKEGGGQISDIVKCTIFLKDINDFAAVNEVYSDFFGEHKPARSCFEVSNLPKGAGIEIEAIALAKRSVKCL